MLFADAPIISMETLIFYAHHLDQLKLDAKRLQIVAKLNLALMKNA